MNTLVIALFALIAGASAAAIQQQEYIPIVSQTQNSDPDGSFQSAFETANGIRREDSGYLVNAGQKDEAEIIQGRAQWTSPEGIPVELRWTAGPDGVHFEGSHIPKEPETPAAIQRSLEYNAAHPEKAPTSA